MLCKACNCLEDKQGCQTHLESTYEWANLHNFLAKKLVARKRELIRNRTHRRSRPQRKNTTLGNEVNNPHAPYCVSVCLNAVSQHTDSQTWEEREGGRDTRETRGREVAICGGEAAKKALETFFLRLKKALATETEFNVLCCQRGEGVVPLRCDGMWAVTSAPELDPTWELKVFAGRAIFHQRSQITRQADCCLAGGNINVTWALPECDITLGRPQA